MRNDFFSLAPVGCLVLSTSGQILDVNPAGAALLGRTTADLNGRPFGTFVADGDRARCDAYLAGLSTPGAARRIDLQVVRPSGTFWGRLESSAVAGHPGACYVVLCDVSDDCTAHEALAASEARLLRAVHEAPLPVAIHTEDGQILALSRAWTDSTGYSAAELSTLDAWIVRAYGRKRLAERQAALRDRFRALLENQDRAHSGETVIRTRDGDTRIWDFHSAALGPMPDGRRAILTMAMDVTERKQAEAELVHARDRAEEMARLKSSFLANMSHEIRTPLTGIIGFAAVLGKELPEEQREFAGLIEDSGRRLLDMLNSVLDLAKLEANQIEIRLDRLDVHEEAEHLVRLLRSLARDKGLELNLEVAEGAAHATAHLDRPALGRVLHNLVGNAIKFTDQGGVTLRLDADDERIYLHVVDTGIGIDPVFVPYLFDEFRQESTGVNRTHGGSGLGLAITRRLVKLMHGRIAVESEKGKGSTFTVSFARAPAVAEAPEADEAVPAAPAGAPGTRARLLLVEDNLDAQHLLLELLDERYDVTVASTAQEAVHLARRGAFDLILMDIQLGEGPDGTDALRDLRALPAYHDTPIVALTAYALPGDRERFLEMGFTAYLSKPFDVDELLRLPDRLLAG